MSDLLKFRGGNNCPPSTYPRYNTAVAVRQAFSLLLPAVATPVLLPPSSLR